MTANQFSSLRIQLANELSDSQIIGGLDSVVVLIVLPIAAIALSVGARQ